MRGIALITGILASISLFASPAHAYRQYRTVEPRIPTSALHAPSRSDQFTNAAVGKRPETQAFRAKKDALKSKRTSKKRECRELIRNAPSGAMVRQTLDCFAGILVLEQELLRQKAGYIEGLASVSEAAKRTAVFAVDSYRQALGQVVANIEGGAYTTVESLKEARKSLKHPYKSQMRIALMHLRIDRAAQWTGQILSRFAEDATAFSPSDSDRISCCFAEQKSALEGLLAVEEYDALKAGYRQAQSDVKFCIQSAREVLRLNNTGEQY